MSATSPLPHQDAPTVSRADSVALAWFYFISMSSGFLWTMVPRYLEELGWTGAAVGVLFSVRKAAEMLTMGLWATWADRTGRPRPLLRLKYTLGALALIGLAASHERASIGVMMALYGVAMGCAYPLLDALVLHHVGSQRYSAVRAWGSTGFGLVALSVAILSGGASYAELVRAIPIVIAALACMAALSTTLLPDARATATAPSWRAAKALLERPILGWLFAIGLLHWSAQQPYNMLFVNLCEDAGLGAWVPGVAVVTGVVAEIALLRNAGALMSRFTPQAWLLSSIIASVARWLLMSHVTSAPAMILIQLSHGLSFGAFLAACIHLLADAIPTHLRATGQATFYFVVFGLGTMLGQLATGSAHDTLGAARTFMAAGLFELALSLVALRFWWQTVYARRQISCGSSG